MRPLPLVLLLLAVLGAGLYVARARQDDGGERAAEGTRQTTERYLTEEQRLQLFDLERADLVLGKALGPFCGAIESDDREGVAAALMEGFEATLPDLDDLTLDPGPRPYALAEPAARTTADRDGFLAWIAELRTYVTAIDHVKFGRKFNSKEILDPEALAESRGTFRIAGRLDGGLVEVAGDFALRHRGFGESIPREDWIAGLELSRVRVVASRAPFFEDVTVRSGIDVDALHDNWESAGEEDGFYTHPGGVVLGDVNMDTHLDVVLTDRGRTWLYLGDGSGRFAPTTWNPPTPTDEISYAAIFDATGDGQREILFNGGLYRFDADTGDVRRVPGATDLPRADIALCDYDRDGLVDVYMLDAGERAPGVRTKAFFDDDRVSGRANRLYRNLGDGHFEDVTASANASGGHGRTFAAVWLHADDDLLPDVVALNEFGRNAFLVQGPDGRFVDTPLEGEAFGGYSMGAAAGDLDGDGRVDVYVSNMYSKAGHRVFHHLPLEVYPESVRSMFRTSVEGNKLYRNIGDRRFEDVSLAARVNVAGWGWSGAILDVDLDGWLDVYAPCGHRSEDRSIPDG